MSRHETLHKNVTWWPDLHGKRHLPSKIHFMCWTNMHRDVEYILCHHVERERESKDVMDTETNHLFWYMILVVCTDAAQTLLRSNFFQATLDSLQCVASLISREEMRGAMAEFLRTFAWTSSWRRKTLNTLLHSKRCKQSMEKVHRSYLQQQQNVGKPCIWVHLSKWIEEYLTLPTCVRWFAAAFKKPT